MLQSVDSTATIPTYGFENDTNTGLGSGAADQLSLIAGGVEGLRIVENTTINIGIAGQGTFGTSADKVLAFPNGVAPSTSVANITQVWSADAEGEDGKAGFHMRDELGNTGQIGFAKSVILTQSGTEAVTAAEMNGQTHVVTGAYVLSLPTAAVGYRATFIASTAAVFSLDLTTGTDVIYLSQTALAAGNKATSDGTIRAACYVECVLEGFYEVTPLQGVFIDGGA